MQLNSILCHWHSLRNTLSNHGTITVSNNLQCYPPKHWYHSIMHTEPCTKTEVITCTAQMSPATSSLLVPYIFMSTMLCNTLNSVLVLSYVATAIHMGNSKYSSFIIYVSFVTTGSMFLNYTILGRIYCLNLGANFLLCLMMSKSTSIYCSRNFLAHKPIY